MFLFLVKIIKYKFLDKLKIRKYFKNKYIFSNCATKL